MKKWLILVMFTFLFVPQVMALEVNHFSSKVDSEVVLEDEYNASVVGAGDSVSIDGKVNGIAILVGNTVETDGEMDYGFILGNSIDIRGIVNGDTFILGNLITTRNGAHFVRDVIVAGNDIEINGDFDRNISVYGSIVAFDDVTIQGNVKIYAEKVVVSSKTVIVGSLSYPKDSVFVDDGASIGKIVKTDAIQTSDDENFFATISAKIWSFLCRALIFAAMVLFFPNIFNKIKAKFEKTEVSEVVEVFTKGLVVIILVPVIVILLCCTIIGLPLGIILLIMYGLAIYLTSVFTAYLVGYKIWQKIFNRESNLMLVGLIGLFILMILSIVPGVRILTSIISILIGLGLIFDSLKK